MGLIGREGEKGRFLQIPKEMSEDKIWPAYLFALGCRLYWAYSTFLTSKHLDLRFFSRLRTWATENMGDFSSKTTEILHRITQTILSKVVASLFEQGSSSHLSIFIWLDMCGRSEICLLYLLGEKDQ